MRVGIPGIDKSDHNYKKIYGWINAFSKITYVTHLPCDNYEVINKKIEEEKLDTIFGEPSFETFEKIDIHKIKTFIYWTDLSIEIMLEYSNKYKNTLFIDAHKSVLTEETISDFIKTFKTEYYMEGILNTNLSKIIESFKKSTNIEDIDYTYKISDNLYYTYLPCSLSERGQINCIEYDVCYFGTTYNRPNVNLYLNELRNMGYRIKSTLFDGHINPEDCIDYYSKTICTLTEIVGPPHLEYPVRLGESSANGCKSLLIDYSTRIQTIYNNSKSELVPEYQIVSSVQDVVCYIESVKKDNKIRSDFYDKFESTYDKALEKIIKIIKHSKIN